MTDPRAEAAAKLQDYDAARFERLLELVGPALAGDLLAHLAKDLTASQKAVQAGARFFDWDQLREGSHVLISLAGSVGALSLQAMAQTLNTSAHREDEATVTKLMPSLSEELAALLTIVQATAAPPKGPA